MGERANQEQCENDFPVNKGSSKVRRISSYHISYQVTSIDCLEDGKLSITPH